MLKIIKQMENIEAKKGDVTFNNFHFIEKQRIFKRFTNTDNNYNNNNNNKDIMHENYI